MKTLFVTDLDGTLLGSDSRVSEKSREIITDLTRRGGLVTVATARTPATVEPLLAGTETAVPAVVMTGASLWDRRWRCFVDPVLFGQDSVGPVSECFLGHGVYPFIYSVTDDNRLTVYRGEAPLSRTEENFCSERRGLALKRFVFSRPGGYGGAFPGAILLLGISAIERIEALADALRGRGGLSVSAYADIFNPKVGYIEVFAAGVSKAEAVMRLKRETGADRLVVYGDNLNDLTMFEVADEAVAVANARPEVKERAARVIGPNTADAVARDMAEVSGL